MSMLKTDQDYEQFMKLTEEALRRGDTTWALQALEDGLIVKHVPRNFRIKLAQVFRRASLNDVSLRLLTPIIHCTTGEEPPTAQETVEYCFALKNIGSILEAEELLAAVPVPLEPKKLIALVHCYFSQWEYEKSIPLLHEYLQLIGEDKYQHLVARVNLIDALVTTDQLGQARNQIQWIQTRLESQNLDRLSVNIKELEGQILIKEGDLDKAKTLLLAALQSMPSRGLKDVLFLEKWLAVVNSFESRSPEPLLLCKKEALARRHWETVRDIDFHLQMVQPQADRLNQLYFGTPYDTYRKNIISRFGPVAEQYDLMGPAERIFDLSTGCENGRPLVKPGSKDHRMLDILSQDFYRPIPIGQIFAHLFAEEKFSIFSSPNRIHQSVTRTRQFLEENNIPISIDEDHSEYSLRFLGAYAIRRHSRVASVSAIGAHRQKLLENFGTNGFSRKEAQNIFNTSTSTVTRILNDLLEAREIQKIGTGAKTQYSCKDDKKAA